MTLTPLLDTSHEAWLQLQALRSTSNSSSNGSNQTNGDAAATTSSVKIDGNSLTVSGLVAVARYGLHPQLDLGPEVVERLEKSIACLKNKIDKGESLYGISTGFGGSADSRTTNLHGLQLALLQHQQCGQLELPHDSHTSRAQGAGSSLLLSEEPLAMPEAWVRAAMVVRLNSLMRGHSGVRALVLQKMALLLEKDIIPVVPVRGSISASGDLSPLSYVAGSLAGQRGIQVWVTSQEGQRVRVPAAEALATHGIERVTYAPKEALGILNGTAFSAGVAGLVISDATNLALLSQIITALATEAGTGTDASYAPFIHQECRPHSGQIEVAATILDLLSGSKLATHLAEEKHLLDEDDEGSLRQDRYPFRTAPQFLGPQFEDLLAAIKTLTIEINSTTDNPLISFEEDHIHHGGNFQASSPANAMEKTRLALALIGRITFAQATELINPAMNRGLNTNLAASDPSGNFHCKGVDIGLAAVTSELQYLAAPVTVHLQSAEQQNQAINSLALISARYTIQSISCLQQLFAWALYLLCQAVDLRALQKTIAADLEASIKKSLKRHFSEWIDDDSSQQSLLAKKVISKLQRRMDETSARDLEARLKESYMTAGFEIVRYFAELPSGGGADPLRNIMAWRDESVQETHALYRKVTAEFLQDPTGLHALPFLGRTSAIYTYIRKDLKVGLHGIDNFHEFKDTKAWLERPTIGENVSIILESIRDGRLFDVMHGVLGKKK